ncbi:hypothetical protein MNV49_007346 [Pseudohyphozyma bogoriensis]|nr:hypothetical protein MNV49_007346 [Pseudohyphozyma bogoriensis]
MQSASFLPKKVVTPLFVTVDVLSLFVQVAGGVMVTSTNPKRVKNGANVLKAGFIIQVIGNLVFIVAIIIARLRARKIGHANRFFIRGLWHIGIGATVVFIRTLYRFLQYVIKDSNGRYPLNSHEWEFIVFDFLFMLPLSIYFAVDYPKKYVDGAEVESSTKEELSMSERQV